MQMKSFKQIISGLDAKKISDGVAAAEMGTAGEIVPMIVLRSSAIGHVPVLLALFIFCLGLMLEIYFQTEQLWMIAANLIFSIALSFILSRFLFVQRYLVPRVDAELQTWRRAHSEFSQAKLSQTQSRVAILIFVSIMEHKAVVLADEGISRLCPQEMWDEVVHILTSHFKRGDWQAGFEKAIARTGEILSRHLPAAAENHNEIPDRLIFKI
jgi:putative membrane protein